MTVRMFEENKIVRCGVAVVVYDRVGRPLMGKRKGSHGAGSWSFPGGWMEFGESFVDTARRELLEETGLELMADLEEGHDIEIIDVMSTWFREDGRHSVTVLLEVHQPIDEGLVPKVMEPDKIDGEWQWINPYKPPEPLFQPLLSSLWVKRTFARAVKL